MQKDFSDASSTLLSLQTNLTIRLPFIINYFITYYGQTADNESEIQHIHIVILTSSTSRNISKLFRLTSFLFDIPLESLDSQLHGRTNNSNQAIYQMGVFLIAPVLYEEHLDVFLWIIWEVSIYVRIYIHTFLYSTYES